MTYYYNSDPYGEATPQQIASREYRYGPMSILIPSGFLLTSFVCVMVGFSGLLQGNVSQLFALGYFGPIFFIMFVIYMVLAIRSITCDMESVTFRHWLGFRHQLSWHEIQYLRIDRMRSTVGFLKGRAITIMFPLGMFYGLQEAPMLMKTIIDRASLQFLRADWKGVHYEHSG